MRVLRQKQGGNGTPGCEYFGQKKVEQKVARPRGYPRAPPGLCPPPGLEQPMHIWHEKENAQRGFMSIGPPVDVESPVNSPHRLSRRPSADSQLVQEGINSSSVPVHDEDLADDYVGSWFCDMKYTSYKVLKGADKKLYWTEETSIGLPISGLLRPIGGGWLEASLMFGRNNPVGVRIQNMMDDTMMVCRKESRDKDWGSPSVIRRRAVEDSMGANMELGFADDGFLASPQSGCVAPPPGLSLPEMPSTPVPDNINSELHSGLCSLLKDKAFLNKFISQDGVSTCASTPVSPFRVFHDVDY